MDVYILQVIISILLVVVMILASILLFGVWKLRKHIKENAELSQANAKRISDLEYREAKRHLNKILT